MEYAKTDSRFQTYFKGIVEALQSAKDGHLLNPSRTMKPMEEKYLESSLDLVEQELVPGALEYIKGEVNYSFYECLR